MTSRNLVRYAAVALVILAIWTPGIGSDVAAQTPAKVTVANASAPKGKIAPVKVSVTGVPTPGLRDFQGKLTYNNQVVKAQGVTGLNGYNIAAVNFDTPGEVRFIGFKLSNQISQGEFVQIDMLALGNPGDKSPLELTLTSFNTPSGSISYQVTNGQFTVTTPTALQANFSFEPAEPQVNQEIKFTDKSTGGGNITTWAWDFGDNTTSSVQHPTHKYTQSGNFTVKLTVNDDQGNTSSTTKTVTVIRPGESPPVIVHVYPNPARTTATFVYSLPQKTTKATLYVVNMAGRTVLSRDLTLSATTYQWNLRDMANTAVPNGPYYYVVQAAVQDRGTISSQLGKLVIQR